MNIEERRRHQRLESVELTYVLVDKDGRHLKESMGRVLNVSESGICIETPFQLDPSQYLLLAVALENVLVEVQCRVIHCQDGADGLYETGVEVLDTEGAFGEAVRGFIDYFNRNKA